MINNEKIQNLIVEFLKILKKLEYLESKFQDFFQEISTERNKILSLQKMFSNTGCTKDYVSFQ